MFILFAKIVIFCITLSYFWHIFCDNEICAYWGIITYCVLFDSVFNSKETKKNDFFLKK